MPPTAQSPKTKHAVTATSRVFTIYAIYRQAISNMENMTETRLNSNTSKAVSTGITRNETRTKKKRQGNSCCCHCHPPLFGYSLLSGGLHTSKASPYGCGDWFYTCHAKCNSQKLLNHEPIQSQLQGATGILENASPIDPSASSDLIFIVDKNTLI